MSCTLSLISSDLQNFETVEELYFGEREKENDEEAADSPLDESSSESEDDGETRTCVDFADADLSEKAKVEKFISDTCNCKIGEGGQACSTTISLDDIHVSRNNCHELSSTELDLVVLGAIQSSLNCGEVSESGRSEKKRERTRMTFYFHGKRICKEAFLFLHCISRTKFLSLVKHYKKNGLTLRSHGNKKRLPSSTFSAETVENVVKFILNVAEDQALLLPGRVPGFKRVYVKLLPSVLTKHSLWKTFRNMYRQWPNVGRVFQILRLVESALPFCCNNATSNGLVLDMSKKQQLHSEICKHARRPKSRGYQGSGTASSTRCWRERVLQELLQTIKREHSPILARD